MIHLSNKSKFERNVSTAIELYCIFMVHHQQQKHQQRKKIKSNKSVQVIKSLQWVISNLCNVRARLVSFCDAPIFLYFYEPIDSNPYSTICITSKCGAAASTVKVELCLNLGNLIMMMKQFQYLFWSSAHFPMHGMNAPKCNTLV